MSQAEQPDWPNFGDGPAKPRGLGDRWYLPGAAPTPREAWLSEGFILVESSSNTEDLVRSGLSIEQRERIIEAVRLHQVENSTLPLFSLIPLDLSGKLAIEKEEFVLEAEERARAFRKSYEERQKEWQDEITENLNSQVSMDAVFAKWDLSDPDHPILPPGAFVFDLNTKPEDLSNLALNSRQTDRLMGAIRSIFGLHPDTNIASFSADFPHLDEELKEEGVSFIEDMALMIRESEEAKKRRVRESRQTGFGVDPRLN